MRTLLLVTFLAVTAFAQQQRQAPPPQSQPQHREFTPPQTQPQHREFTPERRPMPVPPMPPHRDPQPPPRPIRNAPAVVIQPNFGYGYGYPYPYYDWYGWRPYYGGTIVVSQPQPCKKEKLKDSNGKKHEILVCRQPDGKFAVVADADQMKVAPEPKK